MDQSRHYWKTSKDKRSPYPHTQIQMHIENILNNVIEDE
ncbi:hypothetical protein T07_7149 [Trichinella nelsoni]|uniref:Uncharacterized protein n=1 Tax=Trichinella nelsoni TaxID=6336 RepID=A0A0V0RC85_9BILA|nr:hypothetical protein T07_7149 [Trichinella nelsoni]